jgi:hypothetical protein
MMESSTHTPASFLKYSESGGYVFDKQLPHRRAYIDESSLKIIVLDSAGITEV